MIGQLHEAECRRRTLDGVRLPLHQGAIEAAGGADLDFPAGIGEERPQDLSGIFSTELGFEQIEDALIESGKLIHAINLSFAASVLRRNAALSWSRIAGLLTKSFMTALCSAVAERPINALP